MLYRELLNLTPKERDIIVAWRILKYPEQLSAEQLSRDLKYPIEDINEAIKKFHKNCRLKLDMWKKEKELEAMITAFFCDE